MCMSWGRNKQRAQECRSRNMRAPRRVLPCCRPSPLPLTVLDILTLPAPSRSRPRTPAVLLQWSNSPSSSAHRHFANGRAWRWQHQGRCSMSTAQLTRSVYELMSARRDWVFIMFSQKSPAVRSPSCAWKGTRRSSTHRSRDLRELRQQRVVQRSARP